MEKIALISDFDGTISFDDFYKLVIKELLDGKASFPTEDYLAGKIKHTDALNHIFNEVNMEEDEFKNFVLTLPIHTDFVKTVKLAKEKNIDFYIISAGCDYYIKLIMEELGVIDYVKILTNYSSYSKETGLVLIPLEKDNPYYSDNVGIDKKKTVEILKENYNKTIYAGDSFVDYEPALVCDVIFARSYLADMLDKANLKYEKLESYKDIYDYINN